MISLFQSLGFRSWRKRRGSRRHGLTNPRSAHGTPRPLSVPPRGSHAAHKAGLRARERADGPSVRAFPRRNAVADANTLAYRCGGSSGLAVAPRTTFPIISCEHLAGVECSDARESGSISHFNCRQSNPPRHRAPPSNRLARVSRFAYDSASVPGVLPPFAVHETGSRCVPRCVHKAGAAPATVGELRSDTTPLGFGPGRLRTAGA